MEYINSSDMSWEEELKMNLCRMEKKVIYQDVLYNLNRKLQEGDGVTVR